MHPYSAGAAGLDASAGSVASYNRFASGVCGAILAPVAVVFMVYALAQYMWRSRRIARREPSARYDDIWGPFFLVLLLVCASTAAIVLAVSSHDWGRLATGATLEHTHAELPGLAGAHHAGADATAIASG